MRAGKLDRRITIRNRTVAADSFGEEIEVFANWQTVWAALEPLSGGESFQGFQRSAKQTVLFRIRFVAGIQPRWRIVYDGETYDIRDVAEISRRRELVLTCDAREVTSGG